MSALNGHSTQSLALRSNFPNLHASRQFKNHSAEMLQLFHADLFRRIARNGCVMIPTRILVDFFQVIERTLVNMIGGRALKNAGDLFQTGGLPEQSRITLAVEVFTYSAQPCPDVFRLVLFAFGELFDLCALGDVPGLRCRLDIERRNSGNTRRTGLQGDGRDLIVVNFVPEKP